VCIGSVPVTGIDSFFLTSFSLFSDSSRGLFKGFFIPVSTLIASFGLAFYISSPLFSSSDSGLSCKLFNRSNSAFIKLSIDS